jgi:hypothetical protein
MLRQTEGTAISAGYDLPEPLPGSPSALIRDGDWNEAVGAITSEVSAHCQWHTLRRHSSRVVTRPLRVCTYDRGAKNKNADAQAVDEAAVTSYIPVDPWRCKDPNAEGRIDPAQIGYGRVTPPDRGQDDDQGADNPAVPCTGTSGRAIDPRRKEKPQSEKNSQGTGPSRRMTIRSGRCHVFYL